MIFRQLFEKESSTYTYILADEGTLEGVIIDPVRETLTRDLQLIEELGIRLLYTLETHVHADHVTAAASIRQKTGAQVVLGAETKVPTADLLLKDDDVLHFGGHTLRAIHTPGHTDGCTCYQIEDRVFTGDTLLIRGCGRTDFQSGSAPLLFASIRSKLFALPDSTLVFPGHDYTGKTCSSIAEEKKFNPRVKLTNTVEQFVEIMANLKLSPPAKIAEAVPANMKSGIS